MSLSYNCKVAEAFEVESGFDVEDLLVDLYYWFDEYKQEKQGFANFVMLDTGML